MKPRRILQHNLHLAQQRRRVWASENREQQKVNFSEKSGIRELTQKSLS